MRIRRIEFSGLSRHTTKVLFAVAMTVLMVWLAFFDSHSLYQRLRWHQEVGRLRVENEEMVRKIEDIQVRLKEAKTDEVIEQIAREQYGMRKPGETVYRVQAAN